MLFDQFSRNQERPQLHPDDNVSNLIEGKYHRRFMRIRPAKPRVIYGAPTIPCVFIGFRLCKLRHLLKNLAKPPLLT